MSMGRAGRLRRITAQLCVLLSVAAAGTAASMTAATASASADTVTSSGSCPAGQVESTFTRPENGDGYNLVFGQDWWGAQDFPALGTSIISAGVWMLSANNGPTELTIAPGPYGTPEPFPDNGTILGQASAAAGQTGLVQVTFAQPIPVNEGEQYLLEVASPTSTSGEVEEQITDPNDLGYGGSYGEAVRSTAGSMALTVSFCGPAQPTLTYSPDSSGATFGAVTGSAVAGETFVAGGPALTSASVWLTTGSSAPLSVSIHAGSPSGAVLGTTEMPAAAAGEQTFDFSPQVALTTGSTYALTVSSAGSAANTAVLAAAASGSTGVQGYLNGSAVDTGLAMQAVFGPADPTGGAGPPPPPLTVSCPAGQVESTYTQPENGQGYNPVYGTESWGAQDFPALGTTIVAAGVWMLSPNNAPTVLSVTPGPAYTPPYFPADGTVLGQASAPAGQVGLVQVAFPEPIPVTEGLQYLLSVTSPSATTGEVAEQITNPSDLGYGGTGGVAVRSSTGSMALTVTFCGPPQPTLTYSPDSSGATFEAVTGSAVAGESFTPGATEALTSAAVWLTTANSAPLSVAVQVGTPSGGTLSTVTLPAGPAGERTVDFPYEVILQQGTTYVLTVSSTGSAANTAVLAAASGVTGVQGYIDGSAVDTNLAMQIGLGPDDPSDLAAFCPLGPQNSSSYVTTIDDALASGTDVLGEQAINAPGGPTLQQVSGEIAPLRSVGGLTDDSVYYLPFSQPDSTGPTTNPEVALHVADGSEFYSNTAGSSSQNTVTLLVGKDGTERYGLCDANQPQPSLADGYLPVLNTRYTDLQGVHYSEQSFAARIAQVSQTSAGYGNLVSFIKLTVDASKAASPVTVNFQMGATGLTQDGDRLVSGSETYLVSSPGGSYTSPDLSYAVNPADGPQTIYIIRLNEPGTASSGLVANAATYNQALRSIERYWNGRLKSGATYSVPEKAVTDAELNTEIQQIELGTYYSLGNSYQVPDFMPEMQNILDTLTEYGDTAEAKAKIQQEVPDAVWPAEPDFTKAAMITAVLTYYELTGDSSLLDQYSPVFSQWLDEFTQQISTDPHGLLSPEQWTGDLSEVCYATSWEEAYGWSAFNGLIRAWDATGNAALAAQYTSTAATFAANLRAAISSSSVTLPDGAIFVPPCLDAGTQPYDPTTASTDGSYYDITIGDLLGTGLITPDSKLAAGLWKYLSNYGAFFLGQDRFEAGADQDAQFGVDQFLAANDDPAELQMRLYADIAMEMTPGTYVSGESYSIQPVDGAYYRSMVLPPNSDSVSDFLETLRVMLVNEQLTVNGAPEGLQLAYSTPAAWLQDGKVITVRNAPTDFGPVSYTIKGLSGKGPGTVRATVQVPDRSPVKNLSIRLDPGDGKVLAGVLVNGERYRRFNAASDTINLSGLKGRVTIVASYRTEQNAG